ncbi:hypothetical protein U1Q18_014295 [Sarracenia purpurea var. burkii]
MAFSYCLVDRDSSRSSTLKFNFGRARDSVTNVLLRNSCYSTFYYVVLTGISVGGRPHALSLFAFAVDDSDWGGIIVDSGTAVTRLKSEAYNALRDEFVQLTRNLPSTGGTPSSTPVTIPLLSRASTSRRWGFGSPARKR